MMPLPVAAVAEVPEEEDEEDELAVAVDGRVVFVRAVASGDEVGFELDEV